MRGFLSMSSAIVRAKMRAAHLEMNIKDWKHQEEKKTELKREAVVKEKAKQKRRVKNTTEPVGALTAAQKQGHKAKQRKKKWNNNNRVLCA